MLWYLALLCSFYCVQPQSTSNPQFIHSTGDWDFRFQAILYTAAMSILIDSCTLVLMWKGFLWVLHLWAELLGNQVYISSPSLDGVKQKVLYQIPLPKTMPEGSYGATFKTTFGTFRLFNFSQLNRHVVRSCCVWKVCFPNWQLD